MKKVHAIHDGFVWVMVSLVLALAAGCAGTKYVTIDEFARQHHMRVCRSADQRCVLTDGKKRVVVSPWASVIVVDGKAMRLAAPVRIRKGRMEIPRNALSHVKPFPRTGRVGGNALSGGRRTMPIIVLDPGHGGKDPGAIGLGGLKEKTVNLAVAQEARRALEARGYIVYMTRQTDVFITLENRPRIAAAHKADAFISIHANIARSRSTSGTESFYVDTKYPAAVRAKMVARTTTLPPSKVGADSGQRFSDGLEQVLYLPLLEEYRLRSKKLAEYVGNEVALAMGVPFRGAKGNHGLRVLRLANCPAILVEVGFLSNPSSVKKLRSRTYHQRIGEAIARGVDRYFQEVWRPALLAK